MTRTDDPGRDGPWDERTLLLTMLRYVQETAVFKVQGLDEEKARHAPIETSPLTTPAALLNHLRWVERSWVNADLFGGEDDGPWTEEGPDAELRQGLELPLDEVIRLYEEEAERTRAVFETVDLDMVMKGEHRRGIPLTARWILLHLIEETARHNGHLDLLREMADGSVGD
jgi:uncharacterized damage-inducible protein DinB